MRPLSRHNIGRNQTLAINLLDHPVTINKGTKLGFFKVFTPTESSELIPIDANMLAQNKLTQGKIFSELNQLVQVDKKRNAQHHKTRT